jgi:hypothetical protein
MYIHESVTYLWKHENIYLKFIEQKYHLRSTVDLLCWNADVRCLYVNRRRTGDWPDSTYILNSMRREKLLSFLEKKTYRGLRVSKDRGRLRGFGRDKD